MEQTLGTRQLSFNKLLSGEVWWPHSSPVSSGWPWHYAASETDALYAMAKALSITSRKKFSLNIYETKQLHHARRHPLGENRKLFMHVLLKSKPMPLYHIFNLTIWIDCTPFIVSACWCIWLGCPYLPGSPVDLLQASTHTWCCCLSFHFVHCW